MKQTKTLLVAAICLASVWSASAVSTSFLRERALNVDGTVTDDPYGAPLPALGGVFDGVIDVGTGLGTFTLMVTGAGSHYAAAFLDHDIDFGNNGSFNEFGGSLGAPAAGQSWELGDPYNSTIYTDFSGSALSNSSLLTGGGINGGDDVSMALGWSFLLAAGDTATIGWTVSETAPAGGFYLVQTDPDSQESIYFSSILRIDNGQGGGGGGGGGGNMPDGGSTLVLLGAGLAALQAFRMQQRRK